METEGLIGNKFLFWLEYCARHGQKLRQHIVANGEGEWIPIYFGLDTVAVSAATILAVAVFFS